MRWASFIRISTTRPCSLIGVEAAGDGIETGRHAASLMGGSPGVLHGNRTYLLQDENGQIIETHSISAGLDYPGVGPEHAWLKDSGPRGIRRHHRRRSAQGVPRLLPHRGHHSGARIEPRAGLRREARADAAEGQGAARQPVGPRRQGHAHGRRAIGHPVLSAADDAQRDRRVRCRSGALQLGQAATSTFATAIS